MDQSLKDPVHLIRRGRWWAADFRSFDKGRPTLRDPDAPGWPKAGARTEDEEVARRWADRYVDVFREQVRRGQLKLGAAPRPLSEAADEFLQERATQRVATNTWENDRAALNHLRVYASEDRQTGKRGDRLRTDQLTEEFLQRFFNTLAREGYAPNTLLGIRRTLSLFLRWLGHGEHNAARRVTLPEVVHEEVETWTPEDLAQLRATADRLDREHPWFRKHRLLVEFGLSSGARRNELFAVRWEQIDSRSCTVRLTHQIHKHRPVLAPLKGKQAGTALLLPEWWEHHRKGARGLILPDIHGNILHPGRFWDVRRDLLVAAGLQRPGRGYHIDRHTYAREFIVLGGRFEELQKSLRHGSIMTTERLYGHLREDVAAALARGRIYGDHPGTRS